MGFDDLEAAEQERRDRDASADSTDDEETVQDDATNAGRTGDASSSDVDADAPAPEADAAASGPDADSSKADAESSSAGSETDASATESLDSPAFEYGEVKQSPMYARPEAWNALEDALDLEVVRALREAGVRNEEKRELHDAVLRVAADHPDEIADAVREARRDRE